jgi:hypothetical protein
MLENAMVVLSCLSRVEKAVSQCISTYNYLTKRANTHRAVSTHSPWYMQQKHKKPQERGGHF